MVKGSIGRIEGKVGGARGVKTCAVGIATGSSSPALLFRAAPSDKYRGAKGEFATEEAQRINTSATKGILCG
jgi:hypothetical protein